jgi:type IV pilus modification protein PilV
MRIAHYKCRQASRGFSLIEVLVAVIIVAIGLLGFASLQISGIQRVEQVKNTRTSNDGLRDLVERVSSLPNVAKAGSFTFSNLDDGHAPAWTLNCRENACTNDQLAAMELGLWFTDLALVAPSPRFSIATEVLSTGTHLTFNLIWDGERTGSGAASCTKASNGTFVANSHQCRTLELLIP